MKKIYKLLFILGTSFIMIGCTPKDNSQQIDSKEYNNLKQMLLDNKYQGQKNYDIVLQKNDDLYSITISNPKPKMCDLQVIALPLHNDNNEDILPNFNILEKQDLTSFYTKEKKIKINYFSEKDIKEFKVLLKYQINQQKKQDIIKLTLK